MQPLRARVHEGRIRLDEPTDLPEGTELELYPADWDEELDGLERARLIEAIEAGAADIERGDFVDGLDYAQQLLDRRAAQTR